MNTHAHPSHFVPLQNHAGQIADPKERLAELKAEKREAKARLREILESLAEKYDIPARDIDYAIDGYADNMLSDLFYGIERDLEHQVEALETP